MPFQTLSSHLMLACLENGKNQRLLGFSTDTRPARDSGEPGIFCFVVFSQRCWQPCLPGANHIRKDYFASLSLMAMKLLQSQLGLEETSLDQPHSNEPKRSGGLREICRKSRWKPLRCLVSFTSKGSWAQVPADWGPRAPAPGK